MRSAIAFTACVVVGVTLVGSLRVSAQTKDPRIGKWQLNVSKSKFTGTAPKSSTRVYEDRGGGVVLFTVTTVNAAGMMGTALVLYRLDGKDYPQVPREAETMTVVSQRLVDAHTIEAVTKANGKVVSTFTQVVSDDGKTLTYTTGKARHKRDSYPQEKGPARIPATGPFAFCSVLHTSQLFFADDVQRHDQPRQQRCSEFVVHLASTLVGTREGVTGATIDADSLDHRVHDPVSR